MGKNITMQPKNFPDNPFDPVSSHRSAKHSVDTDSKPAAASIVGQKNQRKSRPFQPSPLLIHLLKLP
jgi:hypothetical protein